MNTKKQDRKIALLGWSLQSIEAVEELKRPYVVISMPSFEDYAKKYGIPFISWDMEEMMKETPMEQVYEKSRELVEILQQAGVDHVIPIFEDTVEWAGALNAWLKENKREFHHSLLFRHKAKMKRRAQIGGLKIGIFEEARNRDEVREFLKRVNDVLLKNDGEEFDPIHIKPFAKAGAVGHHMIRQEDEIYSRLTDDLFPCLMESHLDGTQLSCEVFIHKGEIKFLNITEYVEFGYSMMAPPSPTIEKNRPLVRKVVKQLVKTFEIENGFIHPEFFITEDGTLNFIEVAFRIPGGNIFDLIQESYGFNPFQAHILCCDPNTTEEELKDFFPNEKKARGYTGSLMVYPRVKEIKALNIPDHLEKHPGFHKHTMFPRKERKVPSMEGFGTPHGVVFFHHQDSEHVKPPLMDFNKHDFYI
ncbi:carboxylate--amine ligase [Halalkalibacillus sediminis]|uniref:Carboxylate--amine ligase n=1 Tax=Halalkalibacillus sediminis TaxID=2018042 RepID=A0A2I0QQP9_9BACI|nr:ATP-grasp domain-containing protein [Halalkalibacillus sediminis]PKR76661.1 carboxylate--amine ligase [Halalkalibacillus sediminis]